MDELNQSLVESKIGGFFISRVRQRLNRDNQNWLCALVGGTGSGKSFSALTLASKIGGKVWIVFTAEEFLFLLTKNKDLSKGDVIIFDEAGVGIGSRDWYSDENKAIMDVLQTFRYLNVGVIFTVPVSSFVDSQARKLYHCIIETQCIDRETNLNYVKVFDIDFNNITNKTYNPHPKMVDEDKHYKMTMMRIGLPPDALRLVYERKQKKYKDFVIKQAHTMILEKKKMRERRTNSVNIPEAIVKNKDKFVQVKRNGKKFIDRDLVAAHFNVGLLSAVKFKKQAEKMLKL